jgi:enamine deaminase RidA (YjgF/YER057c/UK114 family)
MSSPDGRIRVRPYLSMTLRSRPYAFTAVVILAIASAVLVLGQTSSKGKTPAVKADVGKLALDPPTQTLPAEIDLPVAVTVETARVTFQVSPLSSKGLLLQQTRDALKALMQANHGARVVKLRAFVAGTGDARRVRQIVSDVFADKKKPLPALTTIQAGDLPKDGAQILMESVSEETGSRAANPGGLVFFPARLADNPKSAVEELAAAAGQPGVAPVEMVRVTCFLGSNDEAAATEAAAAHAFPAASANGAVAVVQRLRASSGPSSACEGVGRLREHGGNPVQFSSGAALVTAPKLVFTGAQMAFGEKEADLRLGFERLEKTLEAFGVTYRDVVFAGFYPVSRAAEEKTPGLSLEFFRNAAPATTLIFEGLPSPDAAMSMEVIAASKAGS